MSELTVKVFVEKDDFHEHIKTLLVQPSPGLIAELEDKVLKARLEVERKVHVETGSLKSTARMHVKATEGFWQGEVRVGGAAPGMPRDPAYYGVFELARGGTHFFLEPAYEGMGPDEIIKTIIKYFAGGSHDVAAS